MRKVKALLVSTLFNLRLPLFTFLFLTLLVPAAFSATYYVDSSGGNDSNNGSTTSSPWKTLSKVNNRTFQPGDQILLKRGAVWREMLSPPSSGTASAPIVFDAYGTGNNPILLGGSQVPAGATWVSLGGNLYQISLSSYGGARGINVGWRGTIDDSPPATSGRMRKHTTPSRDLDFDQNGGSSTVRVYSSTNPGNYAWEFCGTGGSGWLGNGVYIVNKSYITVRNLDIKLFDYCAVYIQGNSPHNTIENCNFYGAGGDVAASEGRYTTFRNCASYWGCSTPFYLLFSNDDGSGETGAADSIVEGCTAKWNGYYEESGDRGGIGVQCNRCIIRNNTLISNGPSPAFCSNLNGDGGISTWRANNLLIENNYVYDSCRSAIQFHDDPNTYNCTTRYNVVINWGGAGQYDISHNSGVLAAIAGNDPSHWNHRITNNTFINTKASRESVGIALCVPSTSDHQYGTWVRNNIFYSASSMDDFALWIGGDRFGTANDGTQTIINNNAYYVPNKSTKTVVQYNGSHTLASWMGSRLSGCPAADTNSVGSDPQFVDLGNLKVELGAYSPCIDAGVDVGATEDNSGNPIVNLPDIGAHEYQYQASSGSTSTSTSTTTTTTPTTVAPVASFTTTSTSGQAPLTVNFADTSTGSPTSWLWVFGDGSTSTAQHPSNVFAAAGTYTVTLTVSNAAGSNSTSKTITVTAAATTPATPATPTTPTTTTTTPAAGAPVASFYATPTSGQVPFTVNFVDTSTGSPTSWRWVFGDGSTSTAQHPSNGFVVAGTYTVTLTVSNAAGSNSTTKTITATAASTSTTTTTPTTTPPTTSTPTYSISPASKSFNLSAGTGTVSVTATNSGSWSATSNASWITITSVTATQGNGKVYYSVARNRTGSSRQGTMTIAGQTFTVSQSASYSR